MMYDEIMNAMLQGEHENAKVEANLEKDLLASKGTMKSIETCFGKLWVYQGQVQVSTNGVSDDDEVIAFQESGAKKLGIKKADFIERMQGSIIVHLKKTFWAMDERPKQVKDLLPEALVDDLYKASQMGVRKVYYVNYTDKEGADGVFVSLKAKPCIPKSKREEWAKKQLKTTGQDQIAYIGVNTKKSRVGTIVK